MQVTMSQDIRNFLNGTSHRCFLNRISICSMLEVCKWAKLSPFLNPKEYIDINILVYSDIFSLFLNLSSYGVDIFSHYMVVFLVIWIDLWSDYDYVSVVKETRTAVHGTTWLGLVWTLVVSLLVDQFLWQTKLG